MKVAACKINGKDGYVCSYKQDGTYKRKYFYSKKDAEKWKNSYANASSLEEKKSLTLLTSQIDDICAALKILPKGKTLKESVAKAWSNLTDADLQLWKERFDAYKEASGISQKHLKIIKGKTLSLLETFKTFDAISEESIFEFIKSKGSARSTAAQWQSVLNEFFTYCIRNNAIRVNPLMCREINDYGRKKGDGHRAAISVSNTEKFIRFIESKYPQYLKYYVLALFSGIRVAEILRIQERYIDYANQAISLPAEITKKNKAEYLDDFEPNLWEWLEGLKNKPIKAPYAKLSTAIFKKFSLPQNFARHSFATYHYSLYRDPKRTAAITHHTEQQLMNDYMDALVPKNIAADYFKIAPSA
jgi:hypothetical protein|nr:MAG TPA: Integrase [Caudoviricetes sp.]